jgi:hypothetical protein
MPMAVSCLEAGFVLLVAASLWRLGQVKDVSPGRLDETLLLRGITSSVDKLPEKGWSRS